ADFEILKTERSAGGSLAFSSTVGVAVTLRGEKSCRTVTGGEIIAKTESEEFCVSSGLKTEIMPIEEEFEIKYPIGEILFHEENLSVISVSAGSGCIIMDGELRVFVFLLQKTENRDIVKEYRNIPFRLELDYPTATPTAVADGTLTAKNTRLDVTVDENTGLSTVKATVEAEMTGEAFMKEERNVVKDAFSLSYETEPVYSDISYLLPAYRCSLFEKFAENVPLEKEADAGARITATCVKEAKVVSLSQKDGVLNVDCVISCRAFCLSGEGKVTAFDVDFPLSVKKPACEGHKDGYFTTAEIVVTDVQTRLNSLSEAEVYGVIRIDVKGEKTENVKVLSDVTATAEKQPDEHAFSVYLAFCGEDIWTVAKRLNVSPEEVSSLNPDLDFPLVDDERIIIYRQKT
ncbi:MAG: hypothetical protein MJ072_05625, partial [Clostridia bacterium]|nr:hypothetical protein [Clostridia bacterium]